jgi:hypothetical protein
MGLDPPPSRLAMVGGVDGRALARQVPWDGEAGAAFDSPPGVECRRVPIDPWLVPGTARSSAFTTSCHARRGIPVLAALRAEHDAKRPKRCARRGRPRPSRRRRRRGARRRARAVSVGRGALCVAGPAGVLADEQGPARPSRRSPRSGRRGVPGRCRLPASLKLNWQRADQRWLPHRSVAVVDGFRRAGQADITILNYEIVAAHREGLRAACLRRSRRRVTTSRTRGPSAHAARRRQRPVDRAALRPTGPPVANHEELIAQLRVLGRLEDFGPGHASHASSG